MPKTFKPFRRSVLRLTHLEDRLAPATFNIPAGDIAAFRAAITTSNINNQPDVINLAAGATYTFVDVADAADGGNALPSVLTDTNNIVNTLTINGNGASLARSTAVGTPFFRFLREDLSAGLAPPPTLAVNNVTFTNGRIDPAGSNVMGGAVFLAGGNMALSDCTFTGNQAPRGGAVASNQVTTSPKPLDIIRGTFTQNASTNGPGGAIYNISSSVLGITDSTFTGNTAAGDGGAVRVQTSSTTTTITGSTFTNNTASGSLNSGGAVLIQGTTIVRGTTMTGNNAGSGGGGLWVQGNLTVTDSNISNNFANSSVASGGGVFIQGNLTMTNTTVHGNRAGSGGGVSYTGGSSNTSTITSSTITNNQVYFGLASGGGLEVGGPNQVLGNTIIAGNFFEATASSGTGPDVSGSVSSLGYNLMGNGSGATFTGVTTGNQIGTTGAAIDPKLGPLQMNGGRTATRLPLAASPVINAGDPSFASPPGPVNDERGSGYARVEFGRIDIGAAEAQAGRVTSAVVNGGAVQRSRVTDLTVNFGSVVSLPANPAAAFQLVNTTIGPGAVVTLSVDLSGSTATQTVAKLSWTGPVTEGGGSLIDGNYTLTILGSQITGEGGLQLDGNGDGTPGGDNVSTLFRLFGDVDGNKAVNGLDLTAFRGAFGTTSADAAFVAAFDFNGDGVINGTDLTQFRNRFGIILP